MALSMKSTASTWESIKPKVIYFAIGLVAGPVLSGMLGWQVLSGTADDQLRAGIVDQQAVFCAANAHMETTDTSKLDFTARNELAKKHAIMPGGTAADFDVVSACAKKLAA
jgi:hypothetical protein